MDPERTQVRAEAFHSREKRGVAAVVCISVLLGVWLSKYVLESRTFKHVLESHNQNWTLRSDFSNVF